MVDARGTFEVKVDGSTVGFRFGPAAGHFAEKVSGFSISQYFQKFTNGEATSCLMYFFYGGHKFYLLTKLEEAKKLTYASGGSKLATEERDRLQYEFDNCSLVTISDIIEKIGFGECMRIHNEALGIPNLKAPTESETGPEMTEKNTGSETTMKLESSDSDLAQSSSGS